MSCSSIKLISGKSICSRTTDFKNTTQRAEILPLPLLGSFRCFLYDLAKPGHVTVPVSFIDAGKVTFYKENQKDLRVDLLFINNYNHRFVTKKHCPGILSCSSKTRNSIKLITLVGKKEHLLTRITPNGCFLT